MRGTIAAVRAARAVLEAIALGCAAGLLHVLLTGAPALDLVATVLGALGLTLVLQAVLRDARTDRQSVAVTVVVLAAFAAFGATRPARDHQPFDLVTRAVLFAVLGEAVVWRAVSLARDPARWTGARSAALATFALLAITAVTPPADRTALPALALAAAGAAAAALSLSRSAEELELAGSGARGGTSGGSAGGAAAVLGALTLVCAAFLPAVTAALRVVADLIGTVLLPVVYVVALGVGYLAELVYRLLAGGRQLAAVPPPPVVDPDEAERARQTFEATRPVVAGALELLLALVAVAAALILVDRIARERRSTLAAGATLERGAADGYGLRAMLAGLLPVRRHPRRAPRDDGTPAAQVRVLYWRFLERAERSGAGWRSDGETPAEHHARIGSVDPRWLVAAPIVRAFEGVRYGDRVPAGDQVAAARSALDALEAVPSRG